LKLDGERLVDLPPEELVALGARGVAGLGEAEGHGLLIIDTSCPRDSRVPENVPIQLDYVKTVALFV